MIRGLGSVTPMALCVVHDLSTIYLRQRVERVNILNTPNAIYDFWRLRFGGLKDEVLDVSPLNSGCRLLKDGVQSLEEGNKDRATVYSRKIMASALKKGPVVLFYAHNHPNREVIPLEQDNLMTRALALATVTIEVKVHNHLIIARENVLSFRTEVLL